MEYPGLQNNNKSIEKGPDLIIADSVSKLPYNSKSGSIVEVVNKGVKKLTLDAIFPHYFYIHINDTSVGDIARTDDGKTLSILENLEAVYYNSNNLKKIIHYLRVAILGLIYREYEVLENLRWKNLNNIKIFTFKSSKEPYLYNGEEWEKMDYVQKSDFAFDNTPTQDSSSLLTSGVIYNELSNKADLINGKVPSDLLPSYVDDVLEFPEFQNFPEIGESGKIYIDVSTNSCYRWSGSTYIEIQSPIELDEYPILGSTNAIESGGVYSALLEKLDIISDLSEIRLGAAAGATALLSFTETDPTVPSHVKSITQQNITDWNNKQSALTFDNTPTTNSINPVTSDGIKTALDVKADKTELPFVVQMGGDLQTCDTSIVDIYTAYSTGRVVQMKIDDFYTSLSLVSSNSSEAKFAVTDENFSLIISGSNDSGSDVWTLDSFTAQEKLTFDSTPTAGSNNPVTSGGVKTALDKKQDVLVSGTNIKTINNTSLLGSGNISVQTPLTFDSIPTTSSTNPVTSGGVATALTSYVTLSTSQKVTGEKTFVGAKKIKFKKLTANDKLGFTLYDNNNKELCYLEYNTGDLCLGSYYQIPSSQVKSRAGFKMSDVSSGINAVYRILTPYAADAKTPFNLTSTVSDFYFTLGVSNGTTTLVTNSTGLLDISSFFNNYYTKTDTDTLLSEKQGTLVSGTDIKTINGNSILGSGDLEIDGDIYYDGAGTGSYSPSTDTINDCIDSLDSRITALGTPNEIASITAVESNVSGGNNTVTITETNGTSKTFNVKNGVDGVSLGEVALMQTTGDSEESVMSQKAVTEYGRRVTAEDLDGTSNWIREKLTEEGWEFEKYVNSSGTLSARASYCASTFIPVSNIKEHSLTVCYMYSTYSTSYFCFYDSNKNYITGLRYTMNSDNSRTVSIDTSATWDDVAYIRITCNPNKLSECYIKDNTANEYVWRGNEYIEPFCNNFLINSGVFRNTFVSQEEGTSKTKVMSQDALSGLGFANRFTNNITPCKGITTTNQSYRTIGLKLNDKQKQLLEDADTITIRISSKKFWESNNYAGVQGAFWFVYNSAGGFAGMSSCGINNALATLSNVRYYPDHLTFVIDMVNGVVKTYWEKTLLTTFTNDGYKKENVLGESGILKIFNGNTQIPFVLYQFDVYDGDITPVFGITQMKDYLSFDSLSPIIKGNYTQTTHHGQMAPSTYGTATGYTIVQASASSDGYKHITSNSSTTWYPAGYYINHADVGRLIKYCVHIEVVSGAVQIGLRSTSCNSTTPTVVNETTGETVTASNVGVGTYKVIGWGYGVDTWCLKYVSGSPMEVIIKETDWHLISCVISLDCRNLYNGQLYDKEVGMFYPKANTLNEPLSSGRVFVNPTPSYEEFNPIETSVSNRPGHTGQMAITNNNVYISVNKDVWKQINNS